MNLRGKPHLNGRLYNERDIGLNGYPLGDISYLWAGVFRRQIKDFYDTLSRLEEPH
jgi:hypothetical protein